MDEEAISAERPRATQVNDPGPPPPPPRHARGLKLYRRLKARFLLRMNPLHARTPYIRHLPLAAPLIILALVLVNLIVWAIVAMILVSRRGGPALLSTAALAYSLGLRHALDADHITAIDLMTRRLLAGGRRAVTVGTFFSLGHSTIVVVTSVVVAATAAGVSKKFHGFGTVGGIIGSAVSAAFLILLGVLNAYILYRLLLQLRKVIDLPVHQPGDIALTSGEDDPWAVSGGGVMFRILKRLFKLIDRPWKMYPLGVMFGLGFDTSSEVALLGISSIQGAKGTSIWLILIFPILFTAGMCLIDTIDGALMLSLYVSPMDMADRKAKEDHEQTETADPADALLSADVTTQEGNQPTLSPPSVTPNSRATDPLLFLYYSSVLTALTVLVALIIGTIQLLTLILNAANPTGRFWDGVAAASDAYEIIGGGICASFVVVGGLSVWCYRPWRRWVERRRAKLRGEEGG